MSGVGAEDSASRHLVTAPVYGDLLAFAASLTAELTEEIGAGLMHVKLAGDIRFALQLGYLQATLINRRYRWSPPQILRATYIESIIQAVERCLLHGAHVESNRS